MTGKAIYIETGKLDEWRAGLKKARAQGMPVAPVGTGARKYVGNMAGEGYRKKREGSEKWRVEQEIIEGLLDDMNPGMWVLDVPCGEGRFFEFYQHKGFIVRGVDISADQLAAAAKWIKAENNLKFFLSRESILKLDLEDKCVDASVMCRMTRWLEPEECQKAFKELQRVTRDRIIITARREGSHPRPVELFLDAMEEDWSLADDIDGYEEAYRILRFKRKAASNEKPS